MNRPRYPLRRVFAWPGVLAVASVTGLVAGLIGGGGWDWAAWAGLAAPVLASAPAWRRARRRS